MLPLEHFVEGLFQPFAAFRLRPERFVIVDDAVEITARSSGVTEDLAAGFAVRIDPDINRPKYHPFRFSFFDLVAFGLGKVLGDFQRKNPAVVVVPENYLI